MRDDPVKIRYARRVERRATRRLECTGGTTWCQVIDRGALAAELDHMREARDNARAEVERLTEAVRALHQPVGRHNFCGTCAYAPWPCPTYRALEREADR